MAQGNAAMKSGADASDRLAGRLRRRSRPVSWATGWRASSTSGRTRRPQEPSPFRFTQIREAAGVDFKQVSGMDRDKHFPTANGSGLAIFDYDGDGLMDLYFASFNPMPPDITSYREEPAVSQPGGRQV